MSVCVCVCVCDSRFHVVPLQDGLDGQVPHTRVFGEVSLGPELVLQHLGKVPDILARCSLEREREHKGGFVHSMGVGHKHTHTHTHTHTYLSVHAAHLFRALLPLFTHRVSEVNALIVRSECVITVTRRRKQIYDSQREL